MLMMGWESAMAGCAEKGSSGGERTKSGMVNSGGDEQMAPDGRAECWFSDSSQAAEELLDSTGDQCNTSCATTQNNHC